MTYDHHPRIPRSVIASSAALLCLMAACGEVSRADRADNGGGAGSAVAAGQGGGRPTSTPGSGGNAGATTMTGGGNSVANSAGAGAGAGGAAAPDTCALSMGDGASSSGGASSSVGPPPNGFFVYLADTASQGRQVFQVRVHGGFVAPAVRLTPDAGVDGYSVIPQRPAIIAVAGQSNTGYRLTLVDFDQSGATGSLPLRSSSSSSGEGDSDLFSHFGTNSDGSFLFASPGIHFFDLRPSTPTSQDISGYSLTSAYGWIGSRLLFSGSKAGTGDKGWFSADPAASPSAATLFTGSVGGPLGFSIAPNKARAIYPSNSSSDTTWHLLDLTAATPAPIQLTAEALRAPVTSGINAWSPDSRYYLAQVDPGGLALVDVEHPSRTQVVSAEGATNFTFASFSPDSRRLVYVASHGGWQTTQLYGVTLDPDGPSAAYPLIRGTEEEQTAYVNASGLFAWMPDSRYVSYLGQNPHAFYLADASGCSGRRARLKPEQSQPFTLNGIHPAPNARRAAFFSDYESPGTATSVYVADVDDDGSWGEPTRISGQVDVGLAQELRFLDGDWLMYYAEDAARQASMYLAPRDGSTPARLLNDPNDVILHTTWIPDPP